ncbi:Unknown protein sequence [Pseudomonas amygdali pv. dendropanacis]|uniref:Uncharacterized protein n=1 Tax=Pseudomonas amygdali pv. dendropanacis TaxID=235272 RepID=A0A0N8RBK0_PSEA0|nr:Unknown protein sequence [Pseudomonas amygdali pv. dendropanacis]KWS80241.1 hypothetical protein AL051_03355 [Pseudomonas amygdali pv. dendropanacis]
MLRIEKMTYEPISVYQIKRSDIRRLQLEKVSNFSVHSFSDGQRNSLFITIDGMDYSLALYKISLYEAVAAAN